MAAGNGVEGIMQDDQTPFHIIDTKAELMGNNGSQYAGQVVGSTVMSAG